MCRVRILPLSLNWFEFSIRRVVLFTFRQQILPQIFPTAAHRDSLALGALADCAGFRSVSGSLGGSQCRAHARPCARTLGIAGEDWVAGVLA